MNSALKLAPSIIICMCLASSTLAQVKPSLEKMSWLVGSWKGVASGQPFYESWRKKSATELTQFGIKISKSDTVVSVIGKISISDGKAVYGDEQNKWTLSELTSDQMIFMNTQIRFPNTITWRRMKNGHWYCLLSTNEQKIEYDIQRESALDAVVDKWIKKNNKS